MNRGREKETVENGRINGSRMSDGNERRYKKQRREKHFVDDSEMHGEEGLDEEKLS